MIFRQARTGPCSVRTLADRHFQDHPPKGQRWPTTYMKKKMQRLLKLKDQRTSKIKDFLQFPIMTLQ